MIIGILEKQVKFNFFSCFKRIADKAMQGSTHSLLLKVHIFVQKQDCSTTRPLSTTSAFENNVTSFTEIFSLLALLIAMKRLLLEIEDSLGNLLPSFPPFKQFSNLFHTIAMQISNSSRHFVQTLKSCLEHCTGLISRPGPATPGWGPGAHY